MLSAILHDILLMDTGTKTVHCWSWRCKKCDKECIPIRSSSFCICGHRLQYHESGSQEKDFRFAVEAGNEFSLSG